MLVVREIGAGVTHYFLDGRDAGSWTAAAGQLLGLVGPVGGPELRAVLRGTDPRTGRFLPPARHPRRRSGWDLVFSAPKSLSLLAATSAEGESVAGAHAVAVGRVLEHIERRLAVRDAAAPGGLSPAGGLIAARFEHRANAASEPHLHTHVLVANLTRTARGWSGVVNNDWFVGRSRLGALYQLALRSELGTRGWNLEWRLRPDGLADLASVPSPAVRAASSQGRRAATLGRFPARRQATPQAWREKVERAGYDRRAVREAEPPSGPPSGLPAAPGRDLDDPELALRVTTRLAMSRSDFREADVIVAMAATVGNGCLPDQAAAWAGRFCAAAHPTPSPTSAPRWTSTLARRADDRLVGLLEEMHGVAARAGPGADRPYTGVTVLASPPGRSELIAQAGFLERCRTGWERQGMTAAVVAPTGLAAARWEALTGLPAHRSGVPVDVLVVDQADRRSTPELLQLLQTTRGRVGHLILVGGGTLPRVSNPASRGMAEFSARSGVLRCPPAPAWHLGPSPADDRGSNRWGHQAANELLHRWAGGSRTELLVGLGIEEVRAMNRAARQLVAGDGPGRRSEGAGELQASPGTRPPETRGFAAGDRVVVLRSGEGRPPYGTFGHIVDLEASARHLAIRWDGAERATRCGPEVLSGLGHGWAGTVTLAGRAGRDVMLLGSLRAVPRLRPLVRASVEPERPGGHGLDLGRYL